MSDQPLGIDDLYAVGILLGPLHPDYYVWCRRHEQARKIGKRCHQIDHDWQDETDNWSYGYSECRRCGVTSPAVGECQVSDCILVGPFMSEREANRLRDEIAVDAPEHMSTGPLGMEIET